MLPPKTITEGDSTGHHAPDCAKEARKRAKEKARSMNARVFRKHEDNEIALARALAMAAQAQTDAFINRKRKAFRHSKKVWTNASCSSISELEPLDFSDSSSLNSSISSITFLTSPWGSSRSFYSVNAPIAQGPSFFEADKQSKNSAHTPRMPKRSVDDDWVHDLVPEEIKKDLSTDPNISGRVSRPWTEGSPPTSKGLLKPYRMESMRDVSPDNAAGWASDGEVASLSVV